MWCHCNLELYHQWCPSIIQLPGGRGGTAGDELNIINPSEFDVNRRSPGFWRNNNSNIYIYIHIYTHCCILYMNMYIYILYIYPFIIYCLHGFMGCCCHVFWLRHSPSRLRSQWSQSAAFRSSKDMLIACLPKCKILEVFFPSQEKMTRNVDNIMPFPRIALRKNLQ